MVTTSLQDVDAKEITYTVRINLSHSARVKNVQFSSFSSAQMILFQNVIKGVLISKSTVFKVCGQKCAISL